MPQHHLVEDHSVNVVGKRDIQEGLLLVIQRQSNGWSGVGDVVINIDEDYIGRREGIAGVVGARDEEGNRDLAGSECRCRAERERRKTAVWHRRAG